jgi:hypothetical protein
VALVVAVVRGLVHKKVPTDLILYLIQLHQRLAVLAVHQQILLMPQVILVVVVVVLEMMVAIHIQL